MAKQKSSNLIGIFKVDPRLSFVLLWTIFMTPFISQRIIFYYVFRLYRKTLPLVPGEGHFYNESKSEMDQRIEESPSSPLLNRIEISRWVE